MGTIIDILFSALKSLRYGSSLRQIQVLHQKVISFGLQSNVGLCKSLIDLYARNSMFVEAISLFEGLLQFPYVTPDSYIYPSLLKACGGLRNVGYGEKIHGRLVKTGLLSDVVIASALVGVYAKCDRFLLAVKVFDEMPDRDLACWNNVISCYYQSGQCEKALEYFEKMKRSGLRPDSVSFTVAISSCARLLDTERGRQIHEEVSRSGLVMDSFVGAALVDMYQKTGCLNRAKAVFDEIKNKSLVAWNAMIGGYSRTGDAVSCIELVARMARDHVRPSSTTVSSLLSACAESAQLKHGRFVHGFMIRNLLFDDVFALISLLDFYFKCGCVASSEKIFKLLPKSSTVSWNVMISGYVSAGCFFKALDTFDDMRLAGVRPDAISVTSALKACSQLATLEKGKELHEYIKGSDLASSEVVMGTLLDMYTKCGAVNEAECIFSSQMVSRDVVSWTCMIEAHGSHGRAPEALKLFEEMVGAGVRPDRIAFLVVISACSHAGLVDEGLRYFKMMVDEYSISPTTAENSCVVDLLSRAGRLRDAYELVDDPDSLSTLLAACSARGEVELGEEIGHLLVRSDPEDQSTYVALERMYGAANKWEERRAVRWKMKEMGLKKSAGCSWIEVDRRVERFVAGEEGFRGAEAAYECLSLVYGQLGRVGIGQVPEEGAVLVWNILY